jgi:VanZ family protein
MYVITWKKALTAGIWISIFIYATLIFQLSSAPIQAQPQPIQTTYQVINETVTNTVIVPTGQPQRYTPDYLHFFLYIGFGVLLYFGFYIPGRLYRQFALNLAWFSGTLYGLTDEYHQSFVPGRTADWKDAVADASGVLLGILIGMLILFIVLKIRAKFMSKWEKYL